MKSILRVLSALIIAVPFGADAVVPTTMGSNLTAFNNNGGAANNNMWNAATNARTSNTSTPSADFGNCNALIMRCAQPKCAGCTTMEIATPIVAGCVQSTDSCKQYGNDLIQYMAAQLVANASARNAEAESAAAAQAAAQSAQQLQQMQFQMQQMQADMAAQNAATVASLQAALEEQKELTAQAIADASAAQSAAVASAQPTSTSGATTAGGASVIDGLTAAQTAAAENGVSADILAREQITGQIYTAIENAEIAMKALKTTMETAFTYAGCDSKGNNCAGPKRVKVFKERALQFFEPYEDVLDEIYDALIMAQSVGVDITDIYMMLNGTCNAWAQYLCQPGQVMHYTSTTCPDGTSVSNTWSETRNGRRENYTAPHGGAKCQVGQIVPMSDGGCQLTKMLTSDDEVQRNWLYPDEGDTGATVRVGCASEALDNSFLFRGRKKQATIDIETLQRIIEQDAPAVYGMRTLRGTSTGTTPQENGIKFCAVSEKSLQELQSVASLKRLPKTVCVAESKLQHELENEGVVTTETATKAAANGALTFTSHCANSVAANMPECKCVNSVAGASYWAGTCTCPLMYKYDAVSGGCVIDTTGTGSRMSSYTDTLFQDTYKSLNDTIQKGNDSIKQTQMSMCMSFGAQWDFGANTCKCYTANASDMQSCTNIFGVSVGSGLNFNSILGNSKK